MFDAEQSKKRVKKSLPSSSEREGESDGAVSTGEHSRIRTMSIIGQIEGHYLLPEGQKATKYEHLIPELVEIEESDEIDGLLMILNTMGGDVEAGLAIAELVASMKKPSVSLVLGGGHSIGVPLAVSAKRSFIVPSATMTIHPVRMNGLVLGTPQTFSYFEKMQDRIIQFVTANSRIAPERMHALMMETGEMASDVGTVLDGERAVAEGLIDESGSLSDAIRCLREMIETNPKQPGRGVVENPAPPAHHEGPQPKPTEPEPSAPANAAPLTAFPPEGKDPRFDGTPKDQKGGRTDV